MEVKGQISIEDEFTDIFISFINHGMKMKKVVPAFNDAKRLLRHIGSRQKRL